MLSAWVEAGQNPEQFWRLTLREISVIMSGAAKRMEREQMLVDVNSWQTARLVMIGHHNPKKFPEFSKVSSVKPRRKRRQTADEMRSAVMLLNQMFDGKVKKS